MRALLNTAAFYDGRLPELFAGYGRSGSEPPVVVPTSARPQAWAAGTPLLLLRALLELEPDMTDAAFLRMRATARLVGGARSRGRPCVRPALARPLRGGAAVVDLIS